MPGPDFVYEDPEAVHAYLKSSLLAIHFPGDGLDLEGLRAIEESSYRPEKHCRAPDGLHAIGRGSEVA